MKECPMKSRPSRLGLGRYLINSCLTPIDEFCKQTKKKKKDVVVATEDTRRGSSPPLSPRTAHNAQKPSRKAAKKGKGKEKNDGMDDLDVALAELSVK